MLYITNAKYRDFISSVDLDLPFYFNEEKTYYWGCKLNSFDINLNYFTQEEAKLLVISDRLFCDVKQTLNTILFKRLDEQRGNWVYELKAPCYHENKDCDWLHSDFENVRIPRSLDKSLLNEYRRFFIDNKEDYGYQEGKKDPRIFCRLLIDKFNLNEKDNLDQAISLDQFVEYYFNTERYDNSDVSDFNFTLDFNKEYADIKDLINQFKSVTKDISVSDSRSVYFKAKDKEKTKEERIKFDNIFNMRKRLVARILNFHFQKLAQSGFDISKTIFEMIGFRACRSCCQS